MSADGIRWVWQLEEREPADCVDCGARLRNESHAGFRAYRCPSCGRRYTMYDPVRKVRRTIPVGAPAGAA